MSALTYNPFIKRNQYGEAMSKLEKAFDRYARENELVDDPWFDGGPQLSTARQAWDACEKQLLPVIERARDALEVQKCRFCDHDFTCMRCASIKELTALLAECGKGEK